jgi:hypothetical protein
MRARRALPPRSIVWLIASCAAFGTAGGKAGAWKPSSHVALSEISLADVLDDGQITIYEVDYDLREIKTSCEAPRVVGTYTVDAELANAVRNWPDYYRAGVVGPDAYPDIPTGQMIIHPDSKLWLEHVWKSAHDLPAGQLREKALAFTAGFLTHAAGDMYMHTFINYFSGGDFVIGWNAAKHLTAEGYAARFGPQPKSYVMKIDGLETWLHDTFLITPTWTENGKTTELLHAGDPAYSIPSKLGDIRRYLQKDYIEWYQAQIVVYDQQIANAMGWLEWLTATAAKSAFQARWGAVVSYAESWVQDIDDCLNHWVAYSHDIAGRLVLHEGGITTEQISEAKKVSEKFANDYLLSAFGLPDVVGGSLAIVQKVLAFFHITWLEELKKRLLEFMIEKSTGMTVDEWKNYASETVSDMTFNEVFAHPEPPGSQMTDHDTYRLGELRVPNMAGARWDWREFSPGFNTVMAVKMIFLPTDQLKAAMRDLGYTDPELMGPNARNVLLGFLRSLDGGNRFWKDAPRMVAAQDFCRYKTMFMSLTGELAEWRRDCAAAPPPGCGDGACGAGEDCAGCPADCGDCDGIDPCTPGAPIPANEDPCAATVCGVDPFCCEVLWDETCVDEAGALCGGACAAGGPCAHDVCAAGAALDPDCDPCPAGVCAVDPFCCAIGWDATCVDEAASLCGTSCPGTCGDGICAASEDCASCAGDCGACPVSCGDGTCDWDESCELCPGDCGACSGLPTVETAVCGDGACTASGEDCATCAADCGTCPSVCGDGVCDPTEDCSACPFDSGMGSGCSCPLDYQYCDSLGDCVTAWECPIGAFYWGGCDCCLAYDPLDPLICTYCESEIYVFYDYCPGG